MVQALRRAMRILAALLVSAMLLVFSACGITGTTDSGEKTHITLWTWQSTIKNFTEAFEREHPDIVIDVVNAGTNEDEYMQLSNAIQANSGVPDVAYMDYNAVQQFALTGDLQAVDSMGFATIRDDFTESSIAAVTSNGEQYGLPISAGPMVMFYNTKVFQSADIAQPPATWSEYVQDAETIASLGNGMKIANDDADAGLIVSMLWQAGARPFGVNGSTLKIDLSGSKVRRFTDMWQPLLDKNLLNTTTTTRSQEWYQSLSANRIGTILAGAWMTTTLKNNLTESSGDWRIALMPQYEASEQANSENGGGALVLPTGADQEKANAAYEFAQWYAHEGGVDINIQQDGIPPLKSVLNDTSYLEQTDAFFGDQQTHQVIAQAASQVDADWQYPPFMNYAIGISVDSVGQAYLGKMTLYQALQRWGDSLIEYAGQQGFKVT